MFIIRNVERTLGLDCLDENRNIEMTPYFCPFLCRLLNLLVKKHIYSVTHTNAALHTTGSSSVQFAFAFLPSSRQPLPLWSSAIDIFNANYIGFWAIVLRKALHKKMEEWDFENREEIPSFAPRQPSPMQQRSVERFDRRKPMGWGTVTVTS